MKLGGILDSSASFLVDFYDLGIQSARHRQLLYRKSAGAKEFQPSFNNSLV